jgi:hypothetical protein
MGTQLEVECARYTTPLGVLDMNTTMMENDLKFVASRHLSG